MEKTKMKTLDYAKKLRARQAELKTAREKALKAYPGAVKAWRTALKKWCVENLYAKIDAITEKDVRERRDSYNNGLLTNVFDDAPAAPAYPNDKTLRAIGRELTGLAVMGKPETYVGEDDIKKFFGDTEE